MDVTCPRAYGVPVAGPQVVTFAGPSQVSEGHSGSALPPKCRHSVDSTRAVAAAARAGTGCPPGPCRGRRAGAGASQPGAPRGDLLLT